MNSERLLETFLELVTVESPSRHEGAMAALCAQKLEALGFQVRIDDSAAQTGSDTGQIIAYRAGTGAASVALSAHMDTVQPCADIKPQIAEGVVRSDGTTILSSDDKAGIAQILEAVESASERAVPLPEIRILLSTCEELGCLGARSYAPGVIPHGVLCLVMDADGPAGSLVLAAPTKWDFEACFTGQAAHAGVEPEKGRSAIQMAARAIELMPLGRHDAETTSNVGIVEGGSAMNIVAASCRVVGECRSMNAEKVRALKQRMDDALHEGAAAFGGTVAVEWRLSYPGFRIPDNDPDVVMLAQTARDVGLEPRLTTTGGGSDANVLCDMGAKALCLGTGMTNFHTTDEHISLDDLQGGAALVEEVLIRMGAGK